MLPLPTRREAFLVLQVMRLGKAPALGCDCATQWDGVTRHLRPVTGSWAATRRLFLLRFLTSAHDLRGFSFTVALGRGIGLVCQSLVSMRDTSPCCGEERRTSQTNEAQAERLRLDRYVDVLVAPALGTKRTVVLITLHTHPAPQFFAVHKSDSDNTRSYFHFPQLVLANPVPSRTTVLFLNLTANMYFSREQKSAF